MFIKPTKTQLRKGLVRVISKNYYEIDTMVVFKDKKSAVLKQIINTAYKGQDDTVLN